MDKILDELPLDELSLDGQIELTMLAHMISASLSKYKKTDPLENVIENQHVDSD